MTKRKSSKNIPFFKPEEVWISELKPHPRNYREHTELQLQHIVQSVKDNGIYKNIVIAKENTILAGHGLVEALRIMGKRKVPVIRLNLKPHDARALRILAGDNEIARLAEINDRALTDLLKEVQDSEGVSLIGTGFDEQMIAALMFVTRPQDEINKLAEEGEWLGMPDFGGWTDPLKMVIQFKTMADRKAFLEMCGVELSDKSKSMWWPPKEREDLASLIFEG